ncbi:MAG: YCF48-related protein [Candidatus Acidiferrales bacterium]
MKSLNMKPIAAALFCLCVFIAATAHAQILRPLGPEGGDVLSLGQDPEKPQRVYLGTADGHIFGSDDGGEHWELRGRAGSRLDSVVTAILVDPRDGGTLYAATWTRDPAAGGGVFRSADGGRTWLPAGLAGKAVRALVFGNSEAGDAAIDAENVAAHATARGVTLVAGTLDGVYRTRDGGKTWTRISPQDDPELRNLDSVAVDPANADTIYAGTFHLPWKTTDGGLHWSPIHDGMIDDSDVMSLLADRARPGRVYASACSGIYRSDTAGAIWQKVQGIPYTARRTVEILQDPARPEIVFAATTEGLWKTTDSGSTWRRITPADWSVTAMVVGAGAPDRVLIGVEQRGVLASDDGGANFHEANGGFFHRQVFTAAFDATHGGAFLIALANAPDFLLGSDDAGHTWRPTGQGPTQATLGRIYASPDGWWATLTAGGLERYDESKSMWIRAGRAPATVSAKPERRAASGHPSSASAASSRQRDVSFDAQVSDMAFARNKWYAATPTGLLASADRGANWTAAHIGALTKIPVESVRVSSDGKAIWIGSLISIAHSADGGATWKWIDLPPSLGVIQKLEVAENDVAHSGGSAPTLLVETYKGLFISRDAGKTWGAPGHGLPEVPVQDVAMAGSYFLAAMQFGGLYLSDDAGRTWRRLDGSVAEGLFSAVMTTRNSMGSSSVTGMPSSLKASDSPSPISYIIFYAASVTEGLYAIDVAPKLHVAPGGDTGH